MKPIAVQLYSLRELAKADFFAMLKAVADIGFAGVEFAGFYDHKPADIRKALDDLGLKTCGFHIGQYGPDKVESLLEMAETLGCANMVCPWLPKTRFTSTDEIRRTAAVMQATAELLAAHDLRLLYHNHDHEMVKVDGRAGLEILLDSAPSLLAEIDTYWAAFYSRADAPAMVRKFAARTPLLHIKDGMFTPGHVFNTSFGQGKMDIASPIAAADNSVLQWLIVEFDNCQTDMLTAVKESYRYLIDHKLGTGQKT